MTAEIGFLTCRQQESSFFLKCLLVGNGAASPALEGQEAADEGELGFSVERVVDPVPSEDGAEDPPAPDVEHAMETRINELEGVVFFQDAVDGDLVPERIRVEDGLFEHRGDFLSGTENQNSAVVSGRRLVHHATDLAGLDGRQRRGVFCDEDIRVEERDPIEGSHPLEVVEAALLPRELLARGLGVTWIGGSVKDFRQFLRDQIIEAIEQCPTGRRPPPTRPRIADCDNDVALRDP